MSAPYIGDQSQFHTTIHVLSDSDPQRAASYNVALQELADNTLYNKHEHFLLSGDVTDLHNIRVQGTASTYVRRAAIGGRAHTTSGAQWAEDLTFPRRLWKQTSNSTSYPLLIDIDDLLQPFGQIRGVGVVLKGVTGHSDLPATPPIIQLRAYSRLADPTSTGTMLLEASDETAWVSGGSLGAYEQPHEVWVYADPLIPCLTAYNQYQIWVKGETGTNYMPGLAVLSIMVDVGSVV